jgi:hypothetical protein
VLTTTTSNAQGTLGRKPFRLKEIAIGGETVTDEQRVHAEVSKFFEQWFGMHPIQLKVTSAARVQNGRT